MTIDVNAYPVSLSATARTAVLALSVVVGSATPTVDAQEVGIGQLRFATPASLSLAPKIITLTPSIASGASYTLTVDSATPTVGAQTVEFEEVRQFSTATPTIATQTVNLGTPVVIGVTHAALTPSAGSVGLRQAFRVGSVSLSPAMGAIRDAWTLNVGSLPVSLTAANVSFVYGVNYTITVDSLARTLWGESVDLNLSQPTLAVSAAAPSLATYRVGMAITVPLDAESPYFEPFAVPLGVSAKLMGVSLSTSTYAARLAITVPVNSVSPGIAAQDVTLERSIPGYLGVDRVSLRLDTGVIGLVQSASLSITDIVFRDTPLKVNFKERHLNVEFRETPSWQINFKANV